MAVVLASQSPRRRQLMRLVTDTFETDAAGIDEGAFEGGTPEALALRLAEAKAAEVARRRPGDTVIGCDTVVQVRGEALGKPRDRADALRMMELLSGGRHTVHTGVCIVPPCGRPVCFTESTEVEFSAVPRSEMSAYVKTDEPYDKAGGYAVQGRAARYITRVEGCFYNIMGLPVSALYRELALLGAV